MKRPAADIFIAGITQTGPSTYVFMVLLSNKWQLEAESFTDLKDSSNARGGENKESSSSSLVKSTAASTLEKKQKSITTGQLMVMVGVFFNAPLLPLYPILVSNDLKLGTVNVILHSFLAVAWGLQVLGLRLVCGFEGGAETLGKVAPEGGAGVLL
jgi:hypothetical protein